MFNRFIRWLKCHYFVAIGGYCPHCEDEQARRLSKLIREAELKDWDWPFLRINCCGAKEYECPHGVGHGGIHGCDGCCAHESFVKSTQGCSHCSCHPDSDCCECGE